MAEKGEKFRRKTHVERTGPAWRSVSNSSEEESLSPLEKKAKVKLHMSDTVQSSEEDETAAAVELANSVMLKLDLVLQKLDNMEKKLDILEGFVKVVDGKVNKLQDKAEQFESFSRDATTKLKVLDEGMSFANTEIENLKKKVKLLEQTIQENTVNTENKFKGKIEALRNEKLYMEVYQRRENLRFYGIAESFHLPEENVKEVLIGFIQKELNISEADSFEYQRVHRIGKRDPSQEKPRPIIARFLRYSDRERVMSSARKLKGTGFGISPDLPKEIVDRRKELMPKFKKAKEDGKSAFFKRSEPDKLFIEGIRIF